MSHTDGFHSLNTSQKSGGAGVKKVDPDYDFLFKFLIIGDGGPLFLLLLSTLTRSFFYFDSSI